MALPEKLPETWLNCDVKIAVAAPVNRGGNLDFPTFSCKILQDFPQVIEIETVENLRLYPKNMVAYLVKDKAIFGVEPGTRLKLT